MRASASIITSRSNATSTQFLPHSSGGNSMCASHARQSKSFIAASGSLHIRARGRVVLIPRKLNTCRHRTARIWSGRRIASFSGRQAWVRTRATSCDICSSTVRTRRWATAVVWGCCNSPVASTRRASKPRASVRSYSAHPRAVLCSRSLNADSTINRSPTAARHLRRRSHMRTCAALPITDNEGD